MQSYLTGRQGGGCGGGGGMNKDTHVQCTKKMVTQSQEGVWTSAALSRNSLLGLRPGVKRLPQNAVGLIHFLMHTFFMHVNRLV